MKLKTRVVDLVLPLLLLLSASACGQRQQTRFSDTYLGFFDTVITVTAYDRSEADFQTHSRALQEKLTEYHRLFDAYGSYAGVTNVYTLNEKAKNGPVPVDARLFSLLQFGKKVYETTAGRVNICMGAVLSVWREYREAGLADPAAAALPPEETLRAAAAHTDINDLVLDEAAGTVFFADPLLALDVGAIAKGYAAGELAVYARESLWSAAILSLGGNVIAFGENPDTVDGNWRVGVEDPEETRTDYLAVLHLTDLSVVTSGDYQRYYTVDGERYCHIVDPDTLQPGRRFTGVTVVSPDSALADALSTALFLLPAEEGAWLIENTPDAEALWVLPDGSTRCSSGWTAYLKQDGA